MKNISLLHQELEKILLGKPQTIKLTIATLLAKGHLLIEDIPGVGKTLLAAALAKLLGISFERVQCTSDLLPSDLIGTSIFSQKSQMFEFKKGPIFSNMLLVDEINRTSPKTQSALLEAMSEAKISIDSSVYALPEPFMVIATQNPLEHHGTFPLPDSQLDRFLVRIHVGYPDINAEKELLKLGDAFKKIEKLTPVMSIEELKKMQNLVNEIRIDDSLYNYLLAIVHATRNNPRIRQGISPRGGLALLTASRAMAVMEGRDYCIPDDIKEIATYVLAHRIIPSERMNFKSQELLLEELVKNIAVPL